MIRQPHITQSPTPHRILRRYHYLYALNPGHTGPQRGISMDIADWRNKIDELDEQIVRLISQRAEAARAIGDLKSASALPVYEPKREQQVFDHVSRCNPGPLGNAEMLHVYERIIDVMRTLQRKDKQS